MTDHNQGDDDITGMMYAIGAILALSMLLSYFFAF